MGFIKGQVGLRKGKIGYWKGKVGWRKGISWTEEEKRMLSLAHKGQVSTWKGKHLSEETKRKLSLAHKGQTYSIPPSWKGKKHTEESKKMISESLKGHIVSVETKKKLSKKSLNEKNYNWKGGITPLCRKIRNSLEYRLWRYAIMQRDDFRCLKCGNKKKLNVHHKILFSKILEQNKIVFFEEAIRCQLLFDLNNGETLCEICHFGVYHKLKLI